VFAPGVNQQIRGVEGDGGTQRDDVGDRGCRVDAEELEEAFVHLLLVPIELCEEVMDKGVD
jgi:hypothetical protein